MGILPECGERHGSGHHDIANSMCYSFILPPPNDDEVSSFRAQGKLRRFPYLFSRNVKLETAITQPFPLLPML